MFCLLIFDAFCLLMFTRSPSSALLPFFGWEGSPTKIDKKEKQWYRYSNLQNWRT